MLERGSRQFSSGPHRGLYKAKLKSSGPFGGIRVSCMFPYPARPGCATSCGADPWNHMGTPLTHTHAHVCVQGGRGGNRLHAAWRLPLMAVCHQEGRDFLIFSTDTRCRHPKHTQSHRDQASPIVCRLRTQDTPVLLAQQQRGPRLRDAGGLRGAKHT